MGGRQGAALPELRPENGEGEALSPQPAKPAGKGAGLKAKKLGLPLWAWGGLALVAVGVFIYMKRRGSTGGQDQQGAADQAAQAAADQTAAPALGGTPDATGAGGSQVDPNAIAGAVSDALAPAFQQLGDALSSAGALSAGFGGGTDTSGTGDGGVTDAGTAATPGSTTKAQRQGFWWGGSFYGPGGKSYADFTKWERAHGGAVNQVFLAQHPAIEQAFGLPVLPPPPKRSAPKVPTHMQPATHARPAAHPAPAHAKQAPKPKPKTIRSKKRPR